MRYPRLKPETILKLRNSGAVQRPDGKVKNYVYHEPMPEKIQQHDAHRGVYRWAAALTIPFAIAYGSEALTKETTEKRRNEEKRKDMVMKSMKR